MTKLKLIIQKTDKTQMQIGDVALKILFENSPENTPEEIGTKLLISMCHNGIEHSETQRLVTLSTSALGPLPGRGW